MDTSLHASGSDRPLRVLIADDHVGLRAVIAEALRSNEYDVDEAGNGGLALETIRRGGHSVAIIDVRMPVMDGLDVSARVREEGLACRVIVMSAVDASSGLIGSLVACESIVVMSSPVACESAGLRLSAMGVDS